MLTQLPSSLVVPDTAPRDCTSQADAGVAVAVAVGVRVAVRVAEAVGVAVACALRGVGVAVAVAVAVPVGVGVACARRGVGVAVAIAVGVGEAVAVAVAVFVGVGVGVAADTLYQYVLLLKNDAGTNIIEASATVRTLSSDATLSALTLSGIDFGTFDPAATSYTADVANDVAETTVTAAANHSGASISIVIGGVEATDGEVALSEGENVITVVVTAEDGATTKTYTVTVTRAEQPSLIVGELSSDAPPVNFRVTGYDEDEITLAWEIPNNRGITGYLVARYDHDGTEFASSDWSVSGDASGGDSTSHSNTGLTQDTLYRYDLALKSDTGSIIIKKSLEVRTLAAGATALSSDATLSALSLTGVELDPGFATSTYRYSGSVASDVTQTTVTATLRDSAASYLVKLGGREDADGVIGLSPGRNVATIHVAAEDGVTTRVYTVVVTRAKAEDSLSSDATLRLLSLSGVDFGTFDARRRPHTPPQVTNDVTQTTVTPVRNDVEAGHVIKTQRHGGR